MKRRPYVIVLGVFVGLFVAIFAGLLFGGRLPAFRDAAHFYHPLFELCRAEWAAGRVPLWNPYENLGQPLLGDATSSVFYPGKLIFAVIPSYDVAYNLYILMHLPLAAWGVWLLARRYGASIEAAGAGSLAYAFSGSVLCNVNNVVFLIGAAWLPWAMLAAERIAAERKVRWAVALGAVLALMVLGGDPQMAYNAGLLAALRVCCQRGRTAERGGVLCRRPALLALAAAVGVLLSAVQVLPSMEFAVLSTRADVTFAERLSAKITPDSHLDDVYQFSVGPWRLAEFVWPNFSGRQYPTHQRWLSVLPAEGRIWTPTLYMGLLPLLLALAAMRWRCSAAVPAAGAGKTPAPQVFLTWIVILAVLASLGWFGAVWLVNELAAVCGMAKIESVGEPFGGLYWLMTVVLPGYAQFRYSAKLLVVATLALSLLSAVGFDRIFTAPAGRFQRGLVWLGGVSAALFIAALAAWPFWTGWFAGTAPDTFFGPLETAGAWRDLAVGLAQAAIVCGLAWWLLDHRRSLGHFSRIVPAALLVLIAADLWLANGWTIATAPAELWRQLPKFAEAIKLTGADGRFFRDAPTVRPQWSETSSPERLAEAVTWDRDTLWPKYNLPARIAVGEVYGTMMTADYQAFLDAQREMTHQPLAQWILLPPNSLIHAPPLASVPNAALRHDTPGLPRAWVVHRVDWLPPVETHDAAALQRRMDEVLTYDGKPRDLRISAVAEGREVMATQQPPTAEQTRDESCKILSESPPCIVIEARLRTPGMVVLADQFFPGWKAEVATDDAPLQAMQIQRANGVMRGLWLPPGRHTITYRYEPASFHYGAILSALGWVASGVWLCLIYLVRGRRRSPRSSDGQTTA